MRNIVLITFLFCSLMALAQPGVPVHTDHGFIVTVHTNTGKEKPTYLDQVVAHVQVFVGDSLMQNSSSFAPDGLRLMLPSENQFKQSPSAPALFDAALLMGIGDSATALMPIDSMLRSNIPPALRKYNSVRYEIKLLNFVSAAAKRAEQEKLMKDLEKILSQSEQVAADYKAGKLKKQLERTSSGLKYYIVEKVPGVPIGQNQPVQVHYVGMFTDGVPFDNSFESGEPLGFETGVGMMIAGFDEAVMLLPHGTKAYLFLPPALAYGEEGSGPIPPNAELIFYIDIQ